MKKFQLRSWNFLYQSIFFYLSAISLAKTPILLFKLSPVGTSFSWLVLINLYK